MLTLDTLFEFSRSHCLAICAVLIPVNLLATLQTLLLLWFRRPLNQVSLMVGVSSLYALVLILHVATWLAIGVVMAPTYILTVLGCLCLALNWGGLAIALKRSSGEQFAQGKLVTTAN